MWRCRKMYYELVPRNDGCGNALEPLGSTEEGRMERIDISDAQGRSGNGFRTELPFMLSSSASRRSR